MKTRRVTGFSFWIVLFLSLFLYVVTLAPDLTWANHGADGGDFITAIATGGVPHPTGYPTYLISAGAFSVLPLGTLAWRLNLFSALLMAISVGLTFLTLSSLLKSERSGWLASLIASLFLAVSPLVWSQAVIAEVYALHLFFVTLISYFAVTYGELSWKGMFGLGTLMGLGLGNHLTLAFIIPPILYLQVTSPSAIEAQSQTLAAKLKTGGKSVAATLVGLVLSSSIYFTLLARANSNSPVRWHNPLNLSRLWSLVSGQIYQPYVDYSFNRDLLARFWQAIQTSYLQFEWGGWMLAAVGFWVCWRKYRPAAQITTFLAVASLAFTAGYATQDAQAYLIPVAYSGAIWIGIGLQFLTEQLAIQKMNTALLWSPALIYLLLFSRNSMQIADASRDFRAIDYGERVMAEAPPNALIATDEDEETFSLWYYLFVLEKRSDLALVVEPLLAYDWYREVLVETYADLRLSINDEEISAAAIAQANARAYCVTDFTNPQVLDCHP